MYTVSKDIRFEAAHRLVNNYPGNCRHNHGHSYFATVVMKLNPSAKLNNYGFVKDFNDFKELKKWVDDNWDHAVLVSSQDFNWLNWLKSENQRHYIFEDNPTAENIAHVLFDKAAELLNDDCSSVVEVRVKETATSEAVCRLT